MKHRIYFFLLLGLVIAVGYYSIDAAKLISDSSKPGSARLNRNTQDYGAVYISGEEAGFHPMDIVNITDNNSYYDTGYYNQYDFIQKGCSAALIAAMSHYDIAAQMLPGTGEELCDSLTVKNGFVYTEKFQYTNVRDETRYLDCILVASDLRIVYIRFYSDKEYDLTQEETDAALEDFDSSTMSLYYSLIHMSSEDQAMMEMNIDYGNYYDISNRIFIYNACYETFCDTYNGILYSMQNYESSNYPDITSVYKFWLPAFFFVRNGFNYNGFNYNNVVDYNYEVYFCAIAANHILSKIIYSRHLSEPEYTTYQGRIYQSIYFDRNELITIYNPAERTIEGFFTPDYGEVY